MGWPTRRYYGHTVLLCYLMRIDDIHLERAVAWVLGTECFFAVRVDVISFVIHDYVVFLFADLCLMNLFLGRSCLLPSSGSIALLHCYGMDNVLVLH